MSATELAKLICERKVSPVDLVEEFIARIELVNGKLNAVVYLAKEQALPRAHEAHRLIRQKKVDSEKQPLFGVPITIKDCYETKGIPTTCGLPALKKNIPQTDATAVRLLKSAGAIVLGKTNVPPFTKAYESDNPVYGKTNNPHDLTRTPGGSSGGEAAIIAALGSPLGLAGDGGGSIRWPAHCCGLVGLRPAWSRVSRSGQIPPASVNPGPLFQTVGPISRYVEDLHLMLRVISGPDSRDPFTFPLSPPSFGNTMTMPLRISNSSF